VLNAIPRQCKRPIGAGVLDLSGACIAPSGFSSSFLKQNKCCLALVMGGKGF